MAEVSGSEQRRWYDRTILTIVLLFVFFPVGLFALWKNRCIKTSHKGWLTAATLVWAVVLIGMNADDVGTQNKYIAGPDAFNASIPMLMQSKQERKSYPEGVDYLWTELSYFEGATDKLVKLSDYGSDGNWDMLIMAFPFVLNDDYSNLEGMVLVMKLIQVATFCEDDEIQGDEIKDWILAVTKKEGSHTSYDYINGCRVELHKSELRRGSALIGLTVGEKPKTAANEQG